MPKPAHSGERAVPVLALPRPYRGYEPGQEVDEAFARDRPWAVRLRVVEEETEQSHNVGEGGD